MVNQQQSYSYIQLQSSIQNQEETSDSLYDSDQRPPRIFLSSLMTPIYNVLRQRRYRNLLIGLFLFLLVYGFWPRSSDSSDTLLPWSRTASEAEWLQRSERVKRAFLHAYTSYEKHAWGYDELLPATKGHINK